MTGVLNVIYYILCSYTYFLIVLVSLGCAVHLSFFRLLHISQDFFQYIYWKKNPQIGEPMQLKPVLFKGQLYV